MFGKQVFGQHFETPFMGYLSNSAAAVRQEGIEMVIIMAKKFETDWVMTNFVGKVVDSYNVEK